MAILFILIFKVSIQRSGFLHGTFTNTSKYFFKWTLCLFIMNILMFLLILWEFYSLYFDHVYSPNSSQILYSASCPTALFKKEKEKQSLCWLTPGHRAGAALECGWQTRYHPFSVANTNSSLARTGTLRSPPFLNAGTSVWLELV